jgi:hypothetical protein
VKSVKKCLKSQQNFFLLDSNTENDNLEGLDTNTNKNDRLSSQELALMVNKVLIASLKKADKQKKMAKKHSLREIENMKKTYNAASAFTTIMSNMLDKSVGYKDFIDMIKIYFIKLI